MNSAKVTADPGAEFCGLAWPLLDWGLCQEGTVLWRLYPTEKHWDFLLYNMQQSDLHC